MKRSTLLLASFAVVALLSACEAEIPPPGALDVPEGPCGHALYVVSTHEYQSTSVGVVGFDGALLARSIVSSASAPTGLSAALSGDVVAPTTPTTSGELVLVNRTPAGVLTWLDPTGVRPIRQLALGAGTNPKDYVEVSPSRAYVPRGNLNANAENPLERGGDVAVVDRLDPAITASIDIVGAVASHVPGFVAHPERIVAIGDAAFLVATTYGPGFKTSGDSAIVRIDTTTDTVTDVLVLQELRGCLGLASSPDASRLAVACSGTFGGGSDPTLDDGGVAILDVATLSVSATVHATTLGRPPGFSIAWSSNDRVLVPVFGSLDHGTSDALLTVDVAAMGAPEIVLDGAEAFTFGEVRCASDCGGCFLATADGLLRFPVAADGSLGAPTKTRIDAESELSPKFLGVY